MKRNKFEILSELKQARDKRNELALKIHQYRLKYQDTDDLFRAIGLLSLQINDLELELLKPEEEVIADETIEVTDDNLQVYVDGSYSKKNDLTGAGVVILYGGEIYKKSFRVKTDDDHSWNIDGECNAALEAIRLCSGEEAIGGTIIKATNITINYDYAGIEKWATIEWKAKSKIARFYTSEYDRLTSKHGINVTFNKVKAHSGDKFNDIADGLANKATLL